MRLVIVPEATCVSFISAPGDSSCGAPADRSAASTSYSQMSSSRKASTSRRASSRCRASLMTRDVRLVSSSTHGV